MSHLRAHANTCFVNAIRCGQEHSYNFYEMYFIYCYLNNPRVVINNFALFFSFAPMILISGAYFRAAEFRVCSFAECLCVGWKQINCSEAQIMWKNFHNMHSIHRVRTFHAISGLYGPHLTYETAKYSVLWLASRWHLPGRRRHWSNSMHAVFQTAWARQKRTPFTSSPVCNTVVYCSCTQLAQRFTERERFP